MAGRIHAAHDAASELPCSGVRDDAAIFLRLACEGKLKETPAVVKACPDLSVFKRREQMVDHRNGVAVRLCAPILYSAVHAETR